MKTYAFTTNEKNSEKNGLFTIQGYSVNDAMDMLELLGWTVKSYVGIETVPMIFAIRESFDSWSLRIHGYLD